MCDTKQHNEGVAVSIQSILASNMSAAPRVKILINVGCLLDIPTGTYITGKYGESVLNGGLGPVSGVVGRGNTFKSTLAIYQEFCAFSRIMQSVYTTLGIYDTELNVHETRLEQLAFIFKNLRESDPFNAGLITLTDKTMHPGEKWFSLLKVFIENKRKNSKDLAINLPFLDRDGKTLMSTIVPTFGILDSASAFSTSNIEEMQNKNDIGDSATNTMHMKLGAAKTNMMMSLPSMCVGGAHYMCATGHVGDKIVIASGPTAPPPKKQLGAMSVDDTIKGVSSQFFFLMHSCWQTLSAKPLLDQNTKETMYPENDTDDAQYDTDLMVVTIKQLRSKSGMSGGAMEIIVSQTLGVLPSLTEFHYIKSNERFGLEGGTHNYSLALLPDVKLSRTTVRRKLDEDEQLRRAMNITAELCQITNLWRHLDKKYICTPKQLYDDLKEQGYDWTVLLSTRGWWTFNNDQQEVPFLSTMDLLKMRVKEYRPYWLQS